MRKRLPEPIYVTTSAPDWFDFAYSNWQNDIPGWELAVVFHENQWHHRNGRTQQLSKHR